MLVKLRTLKAGFEMFFERRSCSGFVKACYEGFPPGPDSVDLQRSNQPEISEALVLTAENWSMNFISDSHGHMTCSRGFVA